MIKLQAIGHLGRDCVVNNVSGKNVINFSVAHAEKFKDAQGVEINKTIWVECAYWTDRTGIAPYLKKGTQVYVEGQPDVRNYTTKDGTKGSSLSLRVGSIQLLGSAENNSSQGNYAQRVGHGQQGATGRVENNQSASDITEPMDDLPF